MAIHGAINRAAKSGIVSCHLGLSCHMGFQASCTRSTSPIRSSGRRLLSHRSGTSMLEMPRCGHHLAAAGNQWNWPCCGFGAGCGAVQDLQRGGLQDLQGLGPRPMLRCQPRFGQEYLRSLEHDIVFDLVWLDDWYGDSSHSFSFLFQFCCLLSEWQLSNEYKPGTRPNMCPTS